MSPDKINSDAGKILYRCRACGADKNLKWFSGTSCPVCKDNPLCSETLADEVEVQRGQEAFLQAEFESRFGR